MTSVVRAVLVATALLAAALPAASATAAGAPKDGYWRTHTAGQLIELRVANHRVVAVSAEIETKSVGSPDAECGSQRFAFLGPFTGGSSSTAKAFVVDGAASGWAVRGRFTSAKKLTGTAQVIASSRNQCSGTATFTATYSSAK